MSVDPIEEDIQSIDNSFNQSDKNVRRIRIIKEH